MNIQYHNTVTTFGFQLLFPVLNGCVYLLSSRTHEDFGKSSRPVIGRPEKAVVSQRLGSHVSTSPSVSRRLSSTAQTLTGSGQCSQVFKFHPRMRDFVNKLPVELWDSIMFSLRHHDSDSGTLAAFSLVSHCACELTRPHLFHTINVDTGKRRIAVLFNAFLMFTNTSPHLAALVRCLSLSQPKRIPGNALDVDLLSRILAGLPKLQRLSIVANITSRTTHHFNSPVLNLDYLSIKILGRIHKPCSPVAVLRLLSLFGAVRQLSIESTFFQACECVPHDVVGRGDVAWHTDEHFRRLFDVPGHSPNQLRRLTIGALDVSRLRGIFSLVFILKVLLHTTSLESLSCVKLRCSQPRHFSVCGEFIEHFARRLRRCEMELSSYGTEAFTADLGALLDYTVRYFDLIIDS